MSHEISLPELRFSWDRNSKSREPLTILVPPHDRHPVESSRFSPESPPSPSRTHSTLVNFGTIRSPTRDVEAGTMPTTPHTARSNLRDRFTRLFFDVRTIGRGREPDIVPMQPPQLPAWPPLHIEKRHCCEHCTCHRDRRKKRKRDRILIAILIILLLYLFGNVVFLNVRTLNSTGTSSRSAPNTSTTTTLSAAAQQCLSEYNINAPANASSYPCSTCFPILQGVPSDFSDGNPQDAQQIENAIQFCSLRSIFDLANSNGQSGLTTGGWVKNVLFCSWSGVSCDGSGRVSSLQLTFPEVPATLPSEIGGLSGLQSLQVIGDTNVPAGSLPSSINSLTALMTLGLESTAITALPDNLFTSLSKVTTLTLVKNAQMGSDLPSSLTDLSLQNLVVNNQPLNNQLPALSSSSSLQGSMKLLDLSSTSLNGTIPASISSLSSLIELHLDDNNLSPPLPGNFPPKLQLLTLSNNTDLTGSVSGSFCSLTSLQNCDLRGTGLKAAGNCGVCQFS